MGCSEENHAHGGSEIYANKRLVQQLQLVADSYTTTHTRSNEVKKHNREEEEDEHTVVLRSAQLAAFQVFSVPFIAGIHSMPWRSPRSRLSRAIPRLGSSARLS
jgi:hypothetical protein